MSAPDPVRDRTILVTGATGFIGRHLVRTLAERGARVRALVRPTSDLTPIADHVAETFVGDLSDAGSLEGACDGVDAVIHTACAVAMTFDAGRAAEDAFMSVNRDGTVNLAREVLRHPGLRMVHTSSTAAMGPPQTDVVDEDSPCNPRAPYQRSKRAAELALLDLHANDELNVVMLRSCVVAGEGKDRSELLKLLRLVQRGAFPLIGNARHVRKPIIDIDDLVDALILGTHAGRPGGIYLVHSDGNHTMGDIIDAAARIVGRRRGALPIPLPVARAAATVLETATRFAPDLNPPLTHDRIDLFVADRRISIQRARDELGFDPKRQDLDAMLGRTYRYYVDRGLLRPR